MGCYAYRDPVVDPLIEIFQYDQLDGLAMMEIREPPGVYQEFELAAPLVFADALQFFEDEANASGALANTYAFSYDEDAGTITLEADAVFDLKMRYSLWDAYGFAADEFLGLDTYTSSAVVTAFWAPLGLERDAPYPLEEVELLEYRHGRALSMAAYHGRVMRLRIVDTTAKVEEMLASPILGGKIRVHTTDDRNTAYSLAALTGYVDGWVVALSDMRTIGQERHLADVEILLQLDEG